MSNSRNAVLITGLLLLLSLGSLIFLLFPRSEGTEYIADIYQNGVLIRSIPLYQAAEAYSFTIEGENGCTNEIEVRSGSIGILSADCPDKICVSQGFIHNSKQPITCLPNRLVIQLRPVLDTDTEPDIVTY